MPGWHDNRDGYRTRWAPPAPSDLDAHRNFRDFLELTESQELECTAVHEAAHAVLFHLAGATVEHVGIRMRREATGHPARVGVTEVDYNLTLGSLFPALAAGERAEDRLLHEQRLWSPRRAWAVERLASGDRARIERTLLECTGRSMTYGTAPSSCCDYQNLHRATDAALTSAWSAVRTVADALVEHRHLPGLRLARIVADCRVRPGLEARP